MSSTTTSVQSDTFDVEKASKALPGPQWLCERREKYVSKLAEMPWPDTSQELWRYTDINSFSLDDYRPLTLEEVGLPGEKRSPGGGILAAEAGDHSALVVVHDGRVVHHTLEDDLGVKGVVASGIAEMSDDVHAQLSENLGRTSDETADAFTLLNEALSVGGVFIYVPANVVVDKPIVIVHWIEGDKVAAFPRTLVVVDASSSVSVIERFESSNDHILISSITECVVKDNASVKYLTTQEEGKDTTHIGVHRTHVHRDARFESSTISLGGNYVRHRGEVALLGQGAHSDVMAVYYGDHDQLLDFRTMQDHRAEHTTSNLLFKGAVEDQARSVYSGLIRIREGAQHAEAYQTNRNLVLDHGAHAESIPNLMIEANDVKCSHGSTVGPIDDEQLYYLESRGVSPADAEKLIVLGFFEDVFSRLSIPALIEPLRRSVNEKLSALSTKRENEQ
jgi:Fe-S cluster assembly protein SufD